VSSPPPQSSRSHGLVVALTAVLVAGLVAVGVLLALLVQQRSQEPEGPRISPPAAERAGPGPDADPTSGRGTQNFRYSGALAEDFVAALVAGRAEAAYDVLCAAAQAEFHVPAALQARFDDLLGSASGSADRGSVVGTAGTDYVSFFADLPGGGGSSFAVLVEEEDGVLVVCGLDEGSAVPTY
jgi:hypothetical protein